MNVRSAIAISIIPQTCIGKGFSRKYQNLWEDSKSVLFMTWQIGNSEKINYVIFNTIQGVFALSSYLDGLQPVFIYRQTPFKSRKSRFQVLPGNTFQNGSAPKLGGKAFLWAFPTRDWERVKKLKFPTLNFSRVGMGTRL
ncbi:hypothetical protein [Nostoc sp.]|uniref:hypothetical protein n=1 Tax=Nostoc sp. TaxID=1180 RepID=UPI002FF95FB1